MASHTPLVSVVLPAYNAGPYIGEAMQSILAQSFTDFEFIVINDCSTDDTEAVILSFTDPRIVYTKNETNSGLIYGLNKGYAMARGKYIVRMDADDIAAPTRIAEQVAFMEANPAVGICGTAFQSFGKVDTLGVYEEHDADIKLQTLFHCRFCHPTVIIRKQVLVDNGLEYSKDFPHAEDYELWARMAFLTKFANLQAPLLNYRVHDASVTHKHAAVQQQNSVRVIQYLFSTIGSPVSADEVALWSRTCYADFSLNAEEIITVEKVMVNLLQANAKSAYVPAQAMQQFLATKWFNLCYNNSKNKQVRSLFSQSTLSGLVPTTDRLKFKLKALL